MPSKKPKNPRPDLNPRQTAFAIVYAGCGNASEAARQAGYSEKSAGIQGHELLKNPKIQALIDRERAARWERLKMPADEVLARAAMLARSDVRKLFKEDGDHLLPHELDDSTAFCVAGIETELSFSEDGAPPTAVRKYKLRDPTPALRMLAQYHKLIGADVTVNLGAEVAERLGRARKRKRQAEAA